MSTVKSVTFTPPVACDVVVTATFDAYRTAGSDWGTGVQYRCFKTQSAATTYGDSQQVTTTRSRYSAKYVFSVAAGASCEVGLDCVLGEPATARFYNITIVAEEIRR